MPKIRKAERRDQLRAKRRRRLKGYARSSMPAIAQATVKKGDKPRST